MFICPQLHSMFCVIYQLCRVRGAKAVVRLMPHEAADLEPVIHALQAQVRPSPTSFSAGLSWPVALRHGEKEYCAHFRCCCPGTSFPPQNLSSLQIPPSSFPPPRGPVGQDTDDFSTWETRYGLLLWLSMLSLVPFDIDTMDSGLGGGAAPPSGGGAGGAGGVAGASGEWDAKGVAAPVAAVGDRRGQADLVGTILALGMKHLGDAGPTRYVRGGGCVGGVCGCGVFGVFASRGYGAI